jgi:alpha-beta hydrolase superfamily lysophospholipase
MTRVQQGDWDQPDPEAWSARIDAAVRAAGQPLLLIAHSCGVTAVAHWTSRFNTKIAGAFLVAPRMRTETIWTNLSRNSPWRGSCRFLFVPSWLPAKTILTVRLIERDNSPTLGARASSPPGTQDTSTRHLATAPGPRAVDCLKTSAWLWTRIGRISGHGQLMTTKARIGILGCRRLSA